MVSLISDYRNGRRLDPHAPLGRCRIDDPAGIDGLVAEIEWNLVQMPLPRLQRFGTASDEFLYRIGWDDAVNKSEWRDPSSFPNTVAFVQGAAENLLRFAPLLRPLIKRQWAAMVAKLNKLGEYELEEFLFGHDRCDLAPVRAPLRELQDNACFYCGDVIAATPDVDHFLPWARHPDNGIHNLVAAHPGCNNSKRDFLADAGHVQRWTRRIDPASATGSGLREIAAAARWEAHAQRTVAAARNLYGPLSPDAKLWHSREAFVDADTALLARCLRST